MSIPVRARNDLIIAMTLAEIFLLLLFGVGYGYRHRLEGDNREERLIEDLRRVTAENDKNRKVLKEQSARIAELTFSLDRWRKAFPKVDEKTLPKAPGLGGEGHPRCEPPNNVLVEATVVQGRTSVRVLLDSSRLKKWYEQRGLVYPTPGAELTAAPAIDAFLTNVQHFYWDEGANGRNCRFHFRLYYGSKIDGFEGRERFERYFYPSGIYPAGAKR
jgi:hypothetical protein